MKAQIRSKSGVQALVIVPCLIAGWIFWHAGGTCRAQEVKPTPNMAPELQEIVTLAQAQTSDDVIVSYIKRSGKSYTLSADDIISLKNQGISQAVIGALLESKPAVAAPVISPPVQPAPAPVLPAQSPAPSVPPGPPAVSSSMPAPAPALTIEVVGSRTSTVVPTPS
jgi:hypothetical protein